MERGFLVHMTDPYKSELELPKRYNSLIDLANYHAGCVDLITDSGYKWSVVIKSNIRGCFTCQGWVTVLIMLAVEQNDLILFENVDIKTVKLKHVKGHHDRYVNPMFYCVMTNTETKDMLLHTAFMDNYFKNDPLDYRFTLRFGNKRFWTVYIVRRFGTNYSIVDWLHISNDLHLATGDFVIFELLRYNDFNIRVFHKDGLQCIHPESLRAEEVYEVQVDRNLEYESHRLSDMLPSDVDDPDYEFDVHLYLKHNGNDNKKIFYFYKHLYFSLYFAVYFVLSLSYNHNVFIFLRTILIYR
ncbi:putative transcription factor B3-Domain family [Helianthus anomalus]